MSTHRYFNKICCAVLIFTLTFTILLINADALGIQRADIVKGYEARLFDASAVHTIDIVMDDWEGFLAGCTDEEYVSCTVVIDNEAYKNVAIRAKGNTSLSNVKSYGSDRYSFKLEFDHYDSGKSYYGLDKLCLNNIIQDSTYMKDFLCYRMMDSFGAASPLCSYVQITVNGEAWGLYLAVEGVEEAFLERNFGKAYGRLYKPDSQSMGGGKGNGGGFNMEDWDNMPSERPGGRNGGMGSDDVKLIYSDDSYDSYSNIFDNAKTDITDADRDRLISSLKALNENSDIEEVVNVDQVIRYLVVHNFVCNFDSYTGSMIHNYYLYESDGQLSMIPWDYNLAFGGFMGGSDATGMVNYPIDTPVSGGTVESRPMLSWVFANDEYTKLYHEYFSEFISSYFESGYFTGMFDQVSAMIAPYVESDPTKFCTYEEFQTGVQTLKEFCLLRAESVNGQLDGNIPATSDGQSQDSTALVDASAVTLSDMGTMNGMGGDIRGGKPSKDDIMPPGNGHAPQKPKEDMENNGQNEMRPGGMAGLPGENAAQDPDILPVANTSLDINTARGMGAKLWILLCASCGILIAGIAFASLYRRNG